MRTQRERIGVAISTTGDPHRMRFLETCVRAWNAVLDTGDSLFVTVDGDEAACERVRRAVYVWTGAVFRVGQRALDPRHHPSTWYTPETGLRLGVAVNKNTGLELLMDNTSADHLFLSDDDCWPLLRFSLFKHIDLDEPHSMVCWGKGRLRATDRHKAYWSWPRGVMLYTRRDVVWAVGGMDERFGPGGHEHVEWSSRIHNAGHTSDPFCSPLIYALAGVQGDAMRASALWHCEDMPKPGEPNDQHRARRRAMTSIDREARDWAPINKIMNERTGDASYVAFRAHENGRASATLCESLSGRGAGGNT
jgi:hypothetical protein